MANEPGLGARVWHIARRVLALAAALYLAALAGLYLDQRRLIFHPYPTYAPPSATNIGRGMREFPVHTEDGLDLKGWYRPAFAGRRTIVFFHGNSDGILTSVPVAAPYINRGYGFLIVEYRGFSREPGEPSEQGLYRDARAYLHALEASGIPDSRIILYGHSLGTGVATQMATEFPVAGLALLAPFLSVADMAQLRYPLFPARWLTTERFESFRAITRVHCPVLIGHGLVDSVIPTSQGRALYALANPPKTLALYPELGHMNAFGAFATTLLSWLDRLPPPGP
jgi:fermentation-respiration switch protein FrsA (DUF1100 family)